MRRSLRVRLRISSTVLLAAALIVFLAHGRKVRTQRNAGGAQTDFAGDTLTIAQSADMESMEPDSLNSASSINIADLLWGRLLNITPEGTIVPSMASGYRWNEAGTELTFDIKPGLVCENGEPLTAEDVVYTFNRAADPKLGFYGNLPGFVYSAIGFVGARQDGPLKATVIVKGYSSQVVGMLSMAHMLCKRSYADMNERTAAEHPVSSGPYKLVEWIHDDRVILERNDRYTLGRGPFERVVFRDIPEASTRAAELIAGAVDIITNVSPDQKDIIDQSGTATVVSIKGTRRMYVGFNFAPSFAATPGGAAIQKRAVRQALEYAVDVPMICAQLLQFPCERMTGPANLADPAIKPYPYDPDKAEALLDAAGYPRGPDGVRFRLTLQAPNGRYLSDAIVAQAVGQFLSDIGVETKVETSDFNSVFAPLARRHEAGPLFFIGNGGATWSAIYDMSLFSTRTAGTNSGLWFNPEWQAGFDSLKNVRDPVQERAIVDHMLAVFRDDAPWIFLYFQPDFYGVGQRVVWTPRRDELIDVMAIAPKR
jgi:peptide/nickel transport system substrate-binding protein